ncbi:MAG TPA: DUF1615 domain-containing protein [Burkholderiales bacterium]|nr:DUF1615 domain-containing protein [Burkholderiales bacterium]
MAGCASAPEPASTQPPAKTMTPAEARAFIARVLPGGVTNRPAWATDIYAAFAAMEIPATRENVCAVVAITDQESNFRVDPAVPNLSQIAWKEIERQRERAGVPGVVLQGALMIPSPNGRSYRERIDAVKTEQQLSEIFDDFIGMVPLGRTFFADRNPVRTGGPMQVSIAYAESHAASRPYPYPKAGAIRNEVFTRRGGMYFGIAHLLDYPASYASHLYRFADYNAGHYASRNAAFQNAVTLVTGVPLALDGDLLRYEQGQPAKEPGATELATRTLGKRIGISVGEIRDDLEQGRTLAFEKTKLYARVFALADKVSGHPAPRAVLPKILLTSPKITRKLTTDWFANRVDTRYRACLTRAASS